MQTVSTYAAKTPGLFRVPFLRASRLLARRNIRFNLQNMKAFVQSPSLALDPDGVSFDVGVTVQYRTGTAWGASVVIPLVGYAVETDDYFAAATAAILADSTAIANSLVATDIIWPAHSMAAGARSESTLSLTVQTSTGAVGTRVSTAQDAFVFVSENISTTSNISSGGADDLVVEIAPTNSATAGDWVEKARGGQSQTYTLAVAIQGVQVVKGVLPVYVPKGYYIKVRSLGSSGTFSNGVSNSRVVLL